MANQVARFALGSTRTLINGQKVSARCMSGGANPKIKATQEHFLKPNEVPVYVKGGAFDQILYRGTMGACMLGLGLFVYNMGCMAVAKK